MKGDMREINYAGFICARGVRWRGRFSARFGLSGHFWERGEV